VNGIVDVQRPSRVGRKRDIDHAPGHLRGDRHFFKAVEIADHFDLALDLTHNQRGNGHRNRFDGGGFLAVGAIRGCFLPAASGRQQDCGDPDQRHAS
jgi:hypothetical protein